MSGYGGDWSDPHNYQNPHGQQQGWEQQGQYGPDYGYGPPGVPHHQTDNSAAIVALVSNIVSTVMCCNVLSIAGIVTASLAIGRSRTNPGEARNLVMWSWVILGISVVLYIVFIAILIGIGTFADDSSSSSDYNGI